MEDVTPSCSTEPEQFVVKIVNPHIPTKIHITREKKINYHISPVHSDESDADTSDVDATYKIKQKIYNSAI